MIEVMGVTKTFGSHRAVDDASFTAPAGAVTGFLGPNGAGKTTTLRILLGLARASAGQALINGVPYAELVVPRRTVGAVLDSMSFHPGRSGRDHLRIVARAVGIAPERVDEVLDFVALTPAAHRAVGGYSHGMRQRLALASALLGDPEVLVLDEPATGLDPAGMAWLRRLLADWAGQGRTVLFSSHVLSEVELVADRVVIISRSRIVHEGAKAELAGTGRAVVVRTSTPTRLCEVAACSGWQIQQDGHERFVIHGPTADEVGLVASRAGIALAELSQQASGGRLTELFLELTGASTEEQA